MKSERLWAVILALTAFCVGLASGVLLSLRMGPVGDSRPFSQYETQMVEAFDLDAERVKNLRYILQDYEAQIEALKERNIASLDPELVKIGREHRELIRTWVVPPHYHQQFDQWVGGLPGLTSGTKPQ